MITKRRGHKNVDRSRYREYQQVAEHFYSASQTSQELEYWTAAGVLMVHSAIAFADALCIKISCQRSVGESHENTIVLLDSLLPKNKENEQAFNQLKRIIEEKLAYHTSVNYTQYPIQRTY